MHMNHMVHSIQYGCMDNNMPLSMRSPFIHSGYRYGGTYTQCILSLFVLHNETINAWTMIAASMISITSFMYVWIYVRPQSQHITPFIMLTTSPLIHLPFTVGYHTFLCISPIEYMKWMQLDIAFIFIASIPLAFSLAWFVFSPGGILTTIVLTCITAILGIRNIIRLRPNEPIRILRNTMYVGLVIAAYLMPMVVQTYRDVKSGLFAQGEVVPCFATMTAIVCLGIGGAVYSLKYPECCLPGQLDLVGNSHHIMHIAITIAHIAEFVFILSMYYRTHTYITPTKQ